MADKQEAARIGFLIDGDPLTDRMTAIYEFDELSVRVRVPYLAHDDARGRWWSQGAMLMDDPDRTKHSYSPPSELDYFDNVGSVGLIDCRSGGGKRRFGGVSPAAGVGNIHARYAVEGAYEAANFVRPNGLRSEMEASPTGLAIPPSELSSRSMRTGLHRVLAPQRSESTTCCWRE